METFGNALKYLEIQGNTRRNIFRKEMEFIVAFHL